MHHIGDAIPLAVDHVVDDLAARGLTVQSLCRINRVCHLLDGVLAVELQRQANVIDQVGRVTGLDLGQQLGHEVLIGFGIYCCRLDLDVVVLAPLGDGISKEGFHLGEVFAAMGDNELGHLTGWGSRFSTFCAREQRLARHNRPEPQCRPNHPLT